MELKAKYGSKRIAYIHATIVEYRNCNENFQKNYAMQRWILTNWRQSDPPSEKMESSRRSQSRMGILKTVSGNNAEVIAFGRLLKNGLRTELGNNYEEGAGDTLKKH